MVSLQDRKKQLTDRLQALNTRLHGIEDVLETEPTRDFEDYATEHEGDEVLESLGQAGLDEIRMIQAALERIEEGEYGICQRCGADIQPERLDVLPYTPICRTCANDLGG